MQEKPLPADDSAAALKAALAERTRELEEAREREAATAEVLKVISSSAGELEPVFASVLENATRLCEANYGAMWLRDAGTLRNVAFHGELPQSFHEIWHAGSVIPADADVPVARAVRLGKPVFVDDLKKDRSYRENNPLARGSVDLAGIRTLMAVPMLKDGEHIGGITIYRREVRPFTDKQVDLVTSFAAQAVIAIENARLFDELRQTLDQQTATSQVLQVISSSPGDLQPVFQAMLENATRICHADSGTIYRYDGEKFHPEATFGELPELVEYRRQRGAFVPVPGQPLDRLLKVHDVVHSADDTLEPTASPAARLGGARSHIAVPMFKDDALVGAITIYRKQVQPFTGKQVELVQNFAAQAVIAIENTRLLNDLRQRTDDLSELLEQQTATSEVLKVISRSGGELQPVFETLLENATRLCGAKFGTLYLWEGDAFRTTAMHNVPPAFAEMRMREPLVRPEPRSLLRRLMDSKKTVEVPDALKEQAYIDRLPRYVSAVEIGGFRSMIAVPMLKGNDLVGVIIVYRQEAGPFSGKQIDLVENFAAQAVIAIENARLLNELRELLDQQTATSEVLRVVSSSPDELKPVFEAMLDNAVRICGANFGTLYLAEGNKYCMAALHNAPPEFAEFQNRRGWFYPTPGAMLERAMLTKRVCHSADAAAEDVVGNSAKVGGARSTVYVPMLKDGNLVGTIVIYRQEVRPFTAKQVELVENFAAQAVIAIENARLLNELRELLDQQTATSEVLKVIARSTGELEPVFRAMLENATQLCGAKFGTLNLYDGEKFKTSMLHNAPPGFAERRGEAWRPHPKSGLARVAATKQVVHIDDLRSEPPYLEGDPAVVAISDVAGARTLLIVPMLKDDELIGSISIYRQEVQPFTEKQIELVTNFAAQAVIAIENTRLFKELRERTDDLTELLEQQTATSEVLKVISSSPGDLDPVFSTILENATNICGAHFGNLFLYDDDGFRAVAMYNAPPGYAEIRKGHPFNPAPDTGLGRMAATKQVFHIADLRDTVGYKRRDPFAVGGVERGGIRTLLTVPLLKDGKLAGAIIIYRQEVRPFTDKQIALVQNFAAQAVIAIENARLLNELRQRTDDLTELLQQQTATAEVLKVISRATFDLQTVLDTLVEFGCPPLQCRQRLRLPAGRRGVPSWFIIRICAGLPRIHEANTC